MKNILLGSPLLVALGAAGAMAQGAGEGPQGNGPRASFEQLDSNGDGQITLEEMQNRGQARFVQTDTNGDGLLDMAELTAAARRAAAEKVAKMLERKDSNGDGMLSMEELTPPDFDRLFARADTDEDGTISRDEWQAAKSAMRKNRHNEGAVNPESGK